MKFGWINAFAAGIVILMMIPNVVYALKNKGEKNLCANRLMNMLEQIGRYGCVVLMWLPLLVREFGFASVAIMLIYACGNLLLLIAYLLIFTRYLKAKTGKRAIALAVLPACIFLLSGILLKHYLLIGFAVLFTVGHLYVTAKNISAGGTENEL